MKKKSLLIYFVLFASFLSAQIKITGKITDSDLEPLTGASVIVKGTSDGVISDTNGNYKITAKKGDILVFSYIGMIKKEIIIKVEQKIDVKLTSDSYNLNEVISIGYGTSKKSDLTGSVVSIKADNLTNSRIGTVTSSLQGLAAGVQVSTGSLKPGGDATVVIRGLGSLMAGSDPLFVVDGVPVQGGLQDLSSSDIESIEVLKDASSSSIYGSRGSNGVILVTTKKGKAGSNRIAFNTSLATQSMLNKQDLMNAQQYYELVSIASPSTRWSSDELRLLSSGGSTDWQDAVTQNGNYENYNLSISGGNKNLSHYLGFDYYNQIGTIKNSSFDKFSVRYNMDASTFNWLKYGIRFNFIESNLKNINEESDPGYGTMFSAISAQPTAPIFTKDGNYFDGFLNTRANPVAVVNLLDKETLKNRFVGSAYLEIEPIKNLKIKSDNSGELVLYDVSTYEDGKMGQHYTAGGHASIYNTKKRFLQSENTITYLTQIGKNKLTAMGGFSISGIDYDESFADAKNLSSITKYNNLGGATTFGPNSSYASSSTLASFYGRLNYNYNERYLATVTMRADGSSRFAPGHRWGYFPSVAFAWRASEESFLKSVKEINNLKVRLSAGTLGNQTIGDYLYTSTISQGGAWGNYIFGNQLATGSVQNTISNPNLTWEKAEQADLGIDFGIFNNRISVTIDAYYKRTNDLLWLVPLPIESGFSSSLTNIGAIDNKGIEFSLNTVNINGKDFEWTTGFNISFNDNKIIELYSGKQDVNKQYFVGHAIDEYYVLKSNGIWQQNEAARAAIYNCVPGDRKIVDKNNDTVINGDDRDFAGYRTPRFFGSFTNTFKYKGFDLVLFLTYAGGNVINNSIDNYLNSFNVWGNMSKNFYNGYWKTDRPSNIYPAPRIGSPYSNGDGTNANFQKGDYVRLKNIELGYSLNKNITNFIKASNVRIYASVQNLITLSEFTGYDVESSSNTNPYPAAQSYIAGISINF